jgi:hypothetical protein
VSFAELGDRWICAAGDAAVAAGWAIAEAATGLDRAELSLRFTHRTGTSLERWVDSWAFDDPRRLAVWLCQQGAVGAQPILASAPLDPPAAVAALATILRDDAPALIFRPARQDVAAVTGTAQLLATFSAFAPHVPVALLAPAQLVRRYLAETTETSAKARVRQGLPTQSGPHAPGLGRAFGPPQPAPAPLPAGVAHSGAEARLYAALSTDPRTHQRFELNGAIAVDFGGRRAEIDLLWRAGKVAVEVDGYHHFRKPEDYRRDRRKDLALQRDGWLVVRVLAEDIADDLAAVVDHIADTLQTLPERPPPP